ncbi:hypothetical protein GGX14DRAFT_388121 [Mycena pura]|uniref:Uncharacterized protein n=1 Tax=Mycena pura TaxID=153505 RepID=A0AAD6YKS6_9AGAR|nr:hypothetical protein GGX14DRAFT_388121 [Mycena pura]
MSNQYLTRKWNMTKRAGRLSATSMLYKCTQSPVDNVTTQARRSTTREKTDDVHKTSSAIVNLATHPVDRITKSFKTLISRKVAAALDGTSASSSLTSRPFPFRPRKRACSPHHDQLLALLLTVLDAKKIPKDPTAAYMNGSRMEELPLSVQLAWIAIEYLSLHDILRHEEDLPNASLIWEGVRPWIEAMELQDYTSLRPDRARAYFFTMAQLSTHPQTSDRFMNWPGIFTFIGAAWPHIMTLPTSERKARGLLFLQSCLTEPQIVRASDGNLSAMVEGAGGDFAIGKLIVAYAKELLAMPGHFGCSIWPLANLCKNLLTTPFEKTILDVMFSHKLLQSLCDSLTLQSALAIDSLTEWTEMRGIILMVTSIIIRPTGHTRLHTVISEGYVESMLMLLAQKSIPAGVHRMIRYFFTDSLPTGLVKFKSVQALKPRYLKVVGLMRQVVLAGTEEARLFAGIFASSQMTAQEHLTALQAYPVWREQQLKMCANSETCQQADWKHTHRNTCEEWLAGEQMRKGTRDFGIAQKDSNYLRLMLDLKMQTERTAIQEAQRRFIRQGGAPNTMLVLFSYHGSSKISIVEAKSIINLNKTTKVNLPPLAFADVLQRSCTTHGQVMMHALSVAIAGEPHIVVYPYYSGNRVLDLVDRDSERTHQAHIGFH